MYSTLASDRSYASEPSLDFVFISELAIQYVMMYKVYNKSDPTYILHSTGTVHARFSS